ncbi:competence/damage-inducible protein A [Anaerobacillus sp. MEB173]|uniref:competence/damage-inducible protein A n=1 Tax=Anaerobacillus sp. MEB173 TaxID=3383345 RepID=UPI003F924FD4
MNAEIIAIGSELLLGQIVNSNAQFLSKQLAELGINVYYHTVVGDNGSRLSDVINHAKKRADLIIFTGGLGPTKDDLTKETIAAVLNRKLVLDKVALTRIEEYFSRRGRVMTENNKKQAVIIEGSKVLPNDNGMAPGMVFTENEITYLLLPGPPKEMQPMFLSYAKGYLSAEVGGSSIIISRVLRFYDIGESQLETELEDLLDQQTNPTIAPLAGNGDVTIRLTVKHDSEEVAESLLNETEEKIMKRVGEFFYGYDNSSLTEVAFELLKKKKMSIASAESLTGGLFGKRLTSYPGSSSTYAGGILCYTNEVKRDLLHIPAQLLETSGAISKECAQLMAEHVREKLLTDIGISFTGVAGPSKSEGKEVGTVFIGIAYKNKPTVVYSLRLAGNRDEIRNRTVKYGFYYLLKELKKGGNNI